MDIPDREISAFARQLMGDLRHSYPRLLEQEILVEAASGVGLDTQQPLAVLQEARIRVVEEIETSLRLWLAAHNVPIAEMAELQSDTGVHPIIPDDGELTGA